MGNLDSAFWHDDFGFLIDPSHHSVNSTAESRDFRDASIADVLQSSDRLPNLNGAPVASWLLSRLVEATRGGINLDDQENQHNDGGCIYLRWVAFTKALKPRAFFAVLCYSNRIVMAGKCMSNTEPMELAAAFLAPLLEQPGALRKWRVYATDTDPPSAPGKCGRRYVFGWDGTKFLGTRDYE
jgi:hypothetical protein